MKKFILEIAKGLALIFGGVAVILLSTLNCIFESMRIARYYTIKMIHKIVAKRKLDVYWRGKWNRFINNISKSDTNYGSRLYGLMIISQEQGS